MLLLTFTIWFWLWLSFSFALPVIACLQLSPDRSQFFRYESFSLSCESHDYSTIGWKVKKKLFVGNIKPCSTMGSTVSSTVGSTCTISTAYPVDSAVYFCQSTDGQSSNGVNITVTGMCLATVNELKSCHYWIDPDLVVVLQIGPCSWRFLLCPSSKGLLWLCAAGTSSTPPAALSAFTEMEAKSTAAPTAR